MKSALQQVHPDIQLSSDWVELPGHQKRFMHLWSPTTTPVRGHVCIVHGLGEHGGRYVRLAPHIARQGYRVSAFDLPGHGRSPGRRGAIVSYDSLLDEIQFVLRWAQHRDVELPCYLFGHSMGGNLVANYVLRRSELPQAAIVSSPMFISSREPKGLMNVLARSVLRIAPNYTLAAGTETKQLMDDPQEQQILDNDPLFHRRISLRLGAALIDSGKWAIQNAHSPSIPMLVSHGLKDRITLPNASLQFAGRAGKHCQLKLLEDHLHESFRDQRRHEVIQLYIDFLHSLSSK
jgi:alpha-beta hydrolase superfamily lysophospholipase